MHIRIKTAVLFSFLFSCFFVQAQKHAGRHPSVLDVHFFLTGLTESPDFIKTHMVAPGMGAGYLKGISPAFDWGVQLNGSFPSGAGRRGLPPGVKTLFLSAEALIRARMFAKTSLLQPFIVTGMGTSHYRNDLALFLPAGAGLEFNYRDVYFTLQTSYRHPLTGGLKAHVYGSVGIAGMVGKKKKPVARPAPPLPGVYHKKDSTAVAKSTGLPDSDGDGINDNDDQCPSAPGMERYRGCPVPDRDNDGINDEEDLCTELPGLKENRGCPLVNKELTGQMGKAARNIFFETASSKLLPRSYNALDKVVQILNEHPDLKLIIEGHTDSEGTDELNQTLSGNRAGAVLLYLKEKGIRESRMKAIGYGKSRPVADNSVEEGRSKNRRVELRLYFE